MTEHFADSSVSPDYSPRGALSVNLPSFATIDKCSHPIYGTTLLLGTVELSTVYGTFVCHTYQNLIHKGYILALCFGDITGGEIMTRVHSSCVTSETLCAMDCDCVSQLNLALERIVRSGRGIFFYLIQEGRGCGFVGKARNNMLVQDSNETMTTFEAYEALGMKRDYRDYRNVWEVAHMLGVAQAPFVLLTNNPDKIQSFQEIGLKLLRSETVELRPNSFNQYYLAAKRRSGHKLNEALTPKSRQHHMQSAETDWHLYYPFEPIKPFEPSAVEGVERFISCGAYFLPIVPVDGTFVLTEHQLQHAVKMIENPCEIVVLRRFSGRTLVKVDSDDILKRIEFAANWFEVRVYYDIVTSCEVVMLIHGDLSNIVPCIRVHSESILDRFPLKERRYHGKFLRAVQHIVHNGSGVIVLLYHDGRGAGLGNLLLSKAQNNDTYQADIRDFRAVAQILRKVLVQPMIRVLFSGSSREPLSKSLQDEGLHIQAWIDFSIVDSVDPLGHTVVERRILDSPLVLANYAKELRTMMLPSLSKSLRYIVCGVGSSEAHAKYCLHLMERFQRDIRASFKPLTELLLCDKQRDDEAIIVFSQGLSPNIIGALRRWGTKRVILLTAVTSKNNDLSKRHFLDEILLGEGALVNFPPEDEYTVLMRTVGPLAGYVAAHALVTRGHCAEAPIEQLISSFQAQEPPKDFFDGLTKETMLVLLGTFPTSSYYQNLLYKLQEGAFFTCVRYADVLEYAHGTHQLVEGANSARVIFLDQLQDLDPSGLPGRIERTIGTQKCWKIKPRFAEGSLQILELEMVLNDFVLRCMRMFNSNQLTWPGQDTQRFLYSWNGEKQNR